MQHPLRSMKTFNERVYALVKRIPRGKVITYGHVAALLDNPRGARAVGWALHALPENSDVPWQRVVNASRQISTRCEPHNVSLQRQRLEAEGVVFEGETIRRAHMILSEWELLDSDTH